MEWEEAKQTLFRVAMSPRSINYRPTSSLEGLRDASLVLILNPYLSFGVLYKVHCLSHDLYRSTKFAPEKQTNQLQCS